MIYLDTSMLLPLFRQEAASRRVEAFLGRRPAGSFAISLWTRVEFASVMAREVRMKALGAAAAGILLEQFDAMVETSLHVLTPSAVDFNLAREFVAEFRTQLRGPDALHLAIARNARLKEVLSLDGGMLAAAKKLGIKARMGMRAR